jgi:hypothetical protein
MPRTQPTPITRSLADRLERGLRGDGPALDELAGAEPTDDRDRLVTLQLIHDLHLGDLDRVGPAARWQHHPTISEIKCRLEADVLAGLDSDVDPDVDAVTAMRTIARANRIPAVYDWLATDATWDELVSFLALEGGPDAGFDDLVAVCQVGLRGEPKLELARNYWDEMGRGSLAEVHTELHHDLCEAIDMPAVPRDEQPTSGLLRSTLGGILATNRVLQPEMIGALGLLELQAGPRCRRVVQALERLDAPEGAFPFYVEHEQVDPHHGKAWLDNVVTHLADDPTWAEGMVRGAQWRAQVNSAFFAEMAERFTDRVDTDEQLSSRTA